MILGDSTSISQSIPIVERTGNQNQGGHCDLGHRGQSFPVACLCGRYGIICEVIGIEGCTVGILIPNIAGHGKAWNGPQTPSATLFSASVAPLSCSYFAVAFVVAS